jgi:hypothetical protein
MTTESKAISLLLVCRLDRITPKVEVHSNE